MADLFDVASVSWQPARPDMARGVFGKPLLTDGVKVVLTRVTPGGGFLPHCDPYGHLFYFLTGTGTVRAGEREMAARPGLVVRVAPGELHSYENTGEEDLTLLSINIPPF